MALSGSFNTSAWTAESGDKISLLFSWTATQDTGANTSTISWTLKGARSNSGYVNAGGFKVVIDGETVYSKSTSYRINLYNGTVVASGTKPITHNNNGTRTFSVSVEAGIYYYDVNCTGSKTFTLDTIPRASAISCTTANIGSNPTITIERAANSFTHTITYRFGTLTGTIATKTTETSIKSWTIPDSFYTQIPDAKTGWGVLTCVTYNGTTAIGSSTCEFDVTTDEAKCKPTVAGTVVDVNATTIALTGDKNVLVRYQSLARCTIATTLNKNAGSILAKTINNTAVTGNTMDIANVETGTFDFWAKDSREYQNSDKVVKNLVPYIKLTATLTGQRTDPTSGAATLKVEGNYYNGSFGAANNTLTIQYRRGSGSYSTATPTISGNTYSATINLTGLDYKESYLYEVVVTDKVGSVAKSIPIRKGIPVFDWGESDFNFNVPVAIQGQPIVDFIVEQGVDGIWNYRKWQSGVAEAWGETTVTATVQTAYGNGFYNGAVIEQSLPSGLFSTRPQAVAGVFNTSDAQLYYPTISVTRVGQLYYSILSTKSNPSASVGISFRLTGRWK